MAPSKTIAVDFDGVIHDYLKGWQDGSIYGEPVEGAIEAVTKLLSSYKVYILTTRAKQADEIRVWLRKHGAAWADSIEITDVKTAAIAYVDDRAVRFTNWSDIRKLWM